MSKKIFITRQIPDAGIDILRAAGFEIDVWDKKNPPSKRDIISRVKKGGHHAILSQLTDAIDRDFFSSCPSIKIVANYAAGYNNIDLVAAKEKGVTIANTPGVSGQAVAETTVALTLAVSTRIAEGDRFVRSGKFKGFSPFSFIGTDLGGATVGLVGVGDIGSRAAKTFRFGFGAKILYYDVVAHQDIERELGAVRVSSLDDLLRQSDVVTLHVPLLDSTRHLIDARALGLMKRTAILVNTARGPVVDEKALVTALKSGTLRGAGLDVFEFEPKLSAGLAKLPNVVLTPHLASARESVRKAMAEIAARNIVDFFEGKRPTGLVS